MIIESKATRLASHIQVSIEKNDLAPGTRIGTKAELIEQYKVAAGTLNEALRLLQSRGYLTVKPGPRGGAFVSDTVGRMAMSSTLLSIQDDPRQLDECFQVQDALQEMISADAAAACKPEDAERIMRAVEKLRKAEDSSEMLHAMWNTDKEIALTAPNRMLSQIYCFVIDNITSIVKHWPPRSKATDHMVQLHINLANAVIANDPETARALAREHSPIDRINEVRELLKATAS